MGLECSPITRSGGWMGRGGQGSPVKGWDQNIATSETPPVCSNNYRVRKSRTQLSTYPDFEQESTRDK